MQSPLPVSGFVLAGGRSSRMGQDKALLELAGEPLVGHALSKLRGLCEDVAILSNNPALAAFGPVVPDLHPDCGPMSGIEAALLSTKHDWSLILPVDVPFVPIAFLREWMGRTLQHAVLSRTRVALFVVDGVAQPTLLMIHRDLGPYLTEALRQGRFKLYPELKAAAASLFSRSGHAMAETVIEPDVRSRSYFANLNTPEDVAEAGRHADLLET